MKKLKYNIGQLVFLITDEDQKERIIVEILLSNKDAQYKLKCGIEESWHYEIEMINEKNVVKSL